MDPEKKKTLNNAHQAFMDLMLKDCPLKNMTEFIAGDVMGYGTTLHEKLFGIEALAGLIRAQREQGQGLQMRWEIEPVHRWVASHENNAVFVDEVKVNITSDDREIELNLRLTLVFDYRQGTWKIIHWHGSKPEYDEGGTDTWHKDEWKKKNEELQRLVEEKTADLERKNRDLEIEAALERVRSRSMGMQKSEELKEVIQIVYEQLVHLNIKLDHAGFVVDYKSKSDWHFWIADQQEIPSRISHPYFNSVWANQFNEAREKGLDFFTTILNFEEKNKFYSDLFKHVPGLSEDSRKFYFDCPGLAVSNVLMEDVALYIENFSCIPYTDEENAVLKRFGKVFQQTYTRFLDLQKAEAQAREALIELSLEKIRAQVTAMQESSDLLDIVVMMQAEFTKLGHEAHYFWHMRWLPDKYEKALTNGEGTRIGNILELPRGFHGLKNMMDWEKSDEPSAVFALDPETAADYIDKMITLGHFQEIDHSAPGPNEVRDMGGLTFVMARTTHGEIGYTLPGEVPNPPQEDIATLVRFASVFDLAYRRFVDLKIAEANALKAQQDLIEIQQARKNAEKALAELKATQSQLVHAEKMASLGELTAGIAHEIQNPLNFVNNFSEVSAELVEEMKEALAVSRWPLAVEIAEDIKQNLKKINYHGKRADGIVKGMLQHSRTSTGQKEPTDLNTLADEYLRLAYHGLRAKDKSFNANFRLDPDDSLPKTNVVPQDIGRVLLNLINNAFYAVSAKALAKADRIYKPSVTVTTKNLGDRIEIRVKDNGDGIPKEVKDKIFQPFFTTKPTGEGTGLGLSMSYDIITKGHGGELKVESTDGEGTELIIVLSTSA